MWGAMQPQQPALSSVSSHSVQHPVWAPFNLPSAPVEAPPVQQAVAEYIWLQGAEVRSRTKVLESLPQCVTELPVIVVDARLSDQSAEDYFEVVLRPRKIFKDPFRGGASILVLCDAFEPAATTNEARAPTNPTLQPLSSNTRVPCENVLKRAGVAQPVFAAEQEFVAIHPAYPTMIPIGPARSNHSGRSSGGSGRPASKASSATSSRRNSVPLPHEVAGISPPSSPPPSCSPFVNNYPHLLAAEAPQHTLATAAATRQLSEAHLRCCLFAGIKTSGGGATRTPGAWSYKVGPCSGVDFGDDLWMSRFLLQRCAEHAGLQVSFDPAHAFGGHLGCYVKYSSADTRDPSKGLLAIEEQLARLQAKHLHHAWAYSEGRIERLMEHKNLNQFVYAVANCSASVMIPGMTMVRRSGYYVDRRPPADCDPYKVAMMIAATTLELPLPLYLPAPPASVPKFVPADRRNWGDSNWCGSPSSHSGLSSAVCGSADENEDEDDDDSMNTDDLLLDELEKMDGPVGNNEEDECSGDSSAESTGECCSDGTSPALAGSPALAATCFGAAMLAC